MKYVIGGTVRWENVYSGSFPFGALSVREMAFGEKCVGEMSKYHLSYKILIKTYRRILRNIKQKKMMKSLKNTTTSCFTKDTTSCKGPKIHF